MNDPTPLPQIVSILESTPAVLSVWLGALPRCWTSARSPAEVWTPTDVVAHLIHGERTDWMPRLRTILIGDPTAVFDTFDREGHRESRLSADVPALLDTFARERASNLVELRALDLDATALGMCAVHPQLGSVTLSELLSTWAVHDLAHIAQIAALMAKSQRPAVGPWDHPDFFRILQDR